MQKKIYVTCKSKLKESKNFKKLCHNRYRYRYTYSVELCDIWKLTDPTRFVDPKDGADFWKRFYMCKTNDFKDLKGLLKGHCHAIVCQPSSLVLCFRPKQCAV
jgi:hypothetical protein